MQMKKLFFIALLVALPKWCHAFQQVLLPGTISNTTPDAGQTSWNNPDNAKIEDGVITSTRCPGVGTTLLKATNFGFKIPLAATIVGIKVRVKENENTAVMDRSVVLFDLNGSSVGVTDHANLLVDWPTPLSFVTYGSETDLWGRSWSPQDINSSNFGFGIAANRDDVTTQIAEIDVIEMSISYYQPTTIYNGTIYNGTLR